MIRARFTTTEEDYRPVTESTTFPWWCTGFDSDDNAIIVAYEESLENLGKRWPEVDPSEIDYEERSEITYTTRFSKPHYIEETE